MRSAKLPSVERSTRVQETLRTAHRFLAPALAAVAAGYVVWILLSNAHEFMRALRATSRWRLGLAFLAFMGSDSLSALQWIKLLEGLGSEVKGRSGLWRVSGQARLARYVPGKVARPLTLLVGAQRLGYPTRLVMVSIGYQAAFQVSASMAFGALLIILSYGAPSSIHVALKLSLLIALVILGVVIGAPRALVRIFKEPPPRLSMKTVATVIILQMCVNLVGSSGVAILTSAVSGLGSMAYVVGTDILSAVLGTLLGITPAGIGVREGLLTALLSPVIGPASALSVAVLSRVLRTLSDLAFFGIAYVLDRPGQRND